MLIELCIGKALDDGSADSVDPLERLETARILLHRVYSDAGSNYGDVVWRCLECPFYVRDARIENDAFQKEVFNHIVIPLFLDVCNGFRDQGEQA